MVVIQIWFIGGIGRLNNATYLRYTIMKMIINPASRISYCISQEITKCSEVVVVARGPVDSSYVQDQTAKTVWFGFKPVHKPDLLQLGRPTPDPYYQYGEFAEFG
jgi:hypothetical protein